jgi:hypothetical protein
VRKGKHWREMVLSLIITAHEQEWNGLRKAVEAVFRRACQRNSRHQHLARSRVSVGCFPDSTVLTARCANALVSREGAPRT